MATRVCGFIVPQSCLVCGNAGSNTLRDGKFEGNFGTAFYECGLCKAVFSLVFQSKDEISIRMVTPKKRTAWDIARDAKVMTTPGLYWVKAMNDDQTFTPWSLYERTTLGAYVLVWGPPLPDSPAGVRWRGPINPDDMNAEGGA